MSFVQNHRGPYLFNVVRHDVSKPRKSQWSSEWLRDEIDADDVPSLAHSYVNDPRDCIVSVHVWSVPEECFVGAVRRGDMLNA